MPRIHIPPLSVLAAENTRDHDEKRTVSLTGSNHRYLTRVLRLTIGDRLTLFDGKNVEADARIVAIDRRTVTLQLQAVRTVARTEGPELVLVCAVLKHAKMDLAIQKSVELGADRIVPVHFTRSVPKHDPARTGRRTDRWNKIAASAASQCGRIDLPPIETSSPDLDSALALPGCRVTPRKTWAVVFWEGCRKPTLPHALPSDLPLRDRAVLIVGPEGGLTDEELESATRAGFKPVGLGPNILRSETAAIAALTLVAAAAGRFEHPGEHEKTHGTRHGR